MRACVFPFDTCWLIESIRLPLFISFFSSRLGCCGGRGGGPPASSWRDRIWFSGIGMLSPWRKHHLCCWLRCLCFHLCLLQRRMKCLFCLLHGGQETRRACWSKQNADACGVGKRDVDRRGANRWRDGGGDNKLFANQATMSAIALLDWMQQAWLFQPDYWSMWTHIFPAMGEEAVMTKPMPLPLLLSLTVPSCSSSTSVSHPVLISCLICARYLFFFCCLFFPPLRSFSFGLIVYNTRWHYFHPLSEWNEKHLGDVQSRPAVKSFERSPPFRENPNWKPGAPEVTTNKLENAQARNEYRCDLIQKNLKQFP